MILDDNNLELNIRDEVGDRQIEFTNYELENESDEELTETGKINLSKSDFDKMFPINKTKNPRMLVQWDDVCQYTGLGLLLFLNEKYELNLKFNDHLYFHRASKYNDTVDFVEAVIGDKIPRQQIENEFRNNYYEVLQYSPVSNTLISIMNMYNYSTSITFAFRYDDLALTPILSGLESYFKVIKGNYCCLNYISLDENSFEEAMVKIKPNMVFCLNLNRYYSYLLETDGLGDIEFYGPDVHNNLPDEFKNFYFGLLEGMVLPKRCAIHLYKEQMYEIHGRGNDDTDPIGNFITGRNR